MKMIIRLTLGVVIMSMATHAHSREFADVYSECGLGALIFNNEGTTSQNGPILAIISNVTWDLGTTAHSSNVSSEDQCVGSSTTTAAFIYQNAPMIESDISRGEGQYMTAMIESMQCSANSTDILSGLRSDLSEAISTGNRDGSRYESAARLYDSLNQYCSA